MNYYVYAILDPNEDYENEIFNKKPFYIGYGSKNRLKEHLHKRELNRKRNHFLKFQVLKTEQNTCFINLVRLNHY